MIKTKTFDCVEMKNKIQKEILSGRKPEGTIHKKNIEGFLKKVKKIKV